MKLIIRPVPPTINKYIGRSNIWQYQQEKKEYTKLVKMQTIGINPKIKECTMKITFYYKNRIRRDSHNYLKHLLDALVDAEIIEDDNDNVIKELTIIGKIDKDNPRVEIDIEYDKFKYDYCMKRNICNGCAKENECSMKEGDNNEW